MKNVNLIFWVKAISLVANFGSTGSASTSVVHKQRLKKSNFLTPRPPPPLALTAIAITAHISVIFYNILSKIFRKPNFASLKLSNKSH